MMFSLRRYNKQDKTIWDDFLKTAKNGSFLFYRDFMEYHSDRFDDHSLLIFKENKLIAIVPANKKDNKLISHQGLSYGGLILSDAIKFGETAQVFSVVLTYLNKAGISAWIIKNIPRIYHQRPSDEIDWIMFKSGARLFRRDLAMVIDTSSDRLPYQERRKRAIKKVLKSQIKLSEGYHELRPFWEKVLTPNLLEKYGVSPVHSIAEIELLASRFPENIKQHVIYLNGEPVAGCTMFLNKNVAHAQYISSTKIGRDSGCLDYIFDHLIKVEYSGYRYFDFGICNEREGQVINKGLLEWKEGFGARPITHDFYEVKTDEAHLLDNAYIFS